MLLRSYRCGEQQPLRDFMSHLEKCKKRWRQAEDTKPKRERRQMPPEPQLPNQHKVDGFIPNEQLKLLNSLAMHVWKSRSLERCTSCGRTFHREQLEKHRRACHGGQDFKAFGRSRHSYKSTHQAVKTAADKRAADREWEEPKPLRHGRDRAARIELKRQVPPPWGSTKAQSRAATGEESDRMSRLQSRRDFVEQEKAKVKAKYGAWRTTGKRIDTELHAISQDLGTRARWRGAPSSPSSPSGSKCQSRIGTIKERGRESAAATMSIVRSVSKEEKMQKRITELEQTQKKLLSYLESIENKLGAIQAEQTDMHATGFGDTVLTESTR